MRIRLNLLAFAVLLALFPAMAAAQMRGHGGPVRALAISPDGDRVLSGSFDSSAIVWSLRDSAARQVLRFHDSSVNAVAFLGDGRPVTAGEDGRIAIWPSHGSAEPRILTGHEGPVAALAVSPDGQWLASASWDRTVRLWPTAGGTPRVFSGHTQNANAVAFSADGRHLLSGGYDATLRIWDTQSDAAPLIVQLPTPINAISVAGDGEIIAAGADGRVRFLSAGGEERAAVQVTETPVIALTMSPEGKLLAAAGLRGAVAIVDRASRTVQRTLVGPGLPVWSLVFASDNRTLISGGADRMVRRWDAAAGEHLGSVPLASNDDALSRFAGDRGADVFRACVACHTLQSDEGNRAGPTLAGIFGRRIATLPGYSFSDALKRMDIVWTPDTVGKLFEVGPMAYTPGTKMPEQRITSAEDRAALVDFLARATKP